MNLNKTFVAVQDASRNMLALSDKEINQILLAVADAAINKTDFILSENQKDLERMPSTDPKYDRLKLTKSRLQDIAADIRNVAALPSPLGKVLKENVLPNGLKIKRVSVPFGVIGIIYEARPNVSSMYSHSALKAAMLYSERRKRCRLFQPCHNQRDTRGTGAFQRRYTYRGTASCRQRGDCRTTACQRLCRFDNSARQQQPDKLRTPECHSTGYRDRCRRMPYVLRPLWRYKHRSIYHCQCKDTPGQCMQRFGLPDYRSRQLANLPDLCLPAASSNVEIFADEPAYHSLRDKYPVELLRLATEDCYGREFLDYKMAIKTVNSFQEALAHIRKYGSKHSECIITDDKTRAEWFCREVDAACVYVNAPTSFTDGAQFGLGAEIGISTQKLHARGPMALEEITTYKWIVEGSGQTRP